MVKNQYFTIFFTNVMFKKVRSLPAFKAHSSKVHGTNPTTVILENSSILKITIIFIVICKFMTQNNVSYLKYQHLLCKIGIFETKKEKKVHNRVLSMDLLPLLFISPLRREIGLCKKYIQKSEFKLLNVLVSPQIGTLWFVLPC